MSNHTDSTTPVSTSPTDTSNTPSQVRTERSSTPPETSGKPIAPPRRRLFATWLIWLIYRVLGLPVLINIFNHNHPDIVGGVVWQSLWLVPAFILTPWILRGRSPYALLVGSMFTLIYLGASGVVLFTRVYGSSWAEIGVYGLDFVLLFLVNLWLFVLLKRLPSMNKVEKRPRQR